MIKTADWIIDLRPEGGNKGGEIVDKIMTVTLTPETETRLRQKAERDGQEIFDWETIHDTDL